MYKFLYLLLIIFLTACNSPSSGIDNSLYSDGKEIIQMTENNIDSGTLRFSKEQLMKIDNFTSKYTSDSKKLSEKESDFYQLVFWAYVSYMSYGADQEYEYMDKYNESIDKLKTEYNIDVN